MTVEGGAAGNIQLSLNGSGSYMGLGVKGEHPEVEPLKQDKPYIPGPQGRQE